MTLKGLPQKQRTASWHKKHMIRLAKDKKRHKSNTIFTRAQAKATTARREYQTNHQRAQAADTQAYGSLRWYYKLWFWFIKLKPILAVRKVFKKKKHGRKNNTKTNTGQEAGEKHGDRG